MWFHCWYVIFPYNFLCNMYYNSAIIHIPFWRILFLCQLLHTKNVDCMCILKLGTWHQSLSSAYKCRSYHVSWNPTLNSSILSTQYIHLNVYFSVDYMGNPILYCYLSLFAFALFIDKIVFILSWCVEHICQEFTALWCKIYTILP